MDFYIFNPDTDLALANGKRNYTPTEGVQQMINDLAILPLWYARPRSYVIADKEYNQQFADEMAKLFDLDIKLIPLREIANVKETIELFPWGWNYSLRNMFVRAGIDPQRLPSDDNLFVYRYLSQRKIVNTFLDVMAGQPGFCGVSLKAEKAADCAQYFEKQKNAGGVVFKEPWSSSGKGLLWCRSAFTEKDLNWCQRVIENEGYVTMSPIYNKVQDFAMEYFIDENDESKVSFLGYSLFSTDKNGFYKSNELLSNQEIKDYLLTYVSEETLNKALQTIGNMLWQFHYQGCVGVDMMICEEEGKMCIHPCVEINYRATMGYLARILKDDFLTEDAHGKFFIKHFSTHDELVSFVEENKQKAPLDIQNRRLRSGFLPLVPVRPDSMNIAYLDVY